MNSEIKEKRLRESNVGDSVNMSGKEKKISYLNNYFVFKKVRDVDADAVYKTNTGIDVSTIVVEGETIGEGQNLEALEEVEEVEEEVKKPVKRRKKRKKKIKIVTADDE
jgi:hypothetical protein